MAHAAAIFCTVWFCIGMVCAPFVGAFIRHAQCFDDALNDSADSGGQRELNATTHGEGNK